MVKRHQGFTLIELLMVIAIIGTVAMIGPKILTAGTRLFILGQAKLSLQEEARAALYVITRELRQAQSNSIIIDRVGTQPYYSRIRFTKQQGASVTIDQSGSALVLTEGTDVSTLTKNLAFIAFTFPSSDDMTILSVSMTLQKQIYGTSVKALHMASERIRVMN